MPRVVFIPNATSWSFPEEAAPVSWSLPPGNNGGNLTLTAASSGSTPIDGEGVIFSVYFDAVLSYTSACMENGGDLVVVPPGTLAISVTVVRGCGGGPDPTSATVAGAG